MQGSYLAFSSAYHPQSNGQSRMLKKPIEIYLRCYIGTKPKSWSSWLNFVPKSWPSWLNFVEWCYSTTIPSSFDMNPFEALYGFPPPRLSAYVLGTSTNSIVDHQ